MKKKIISVFSVVLIALLFTVNAFGYSSTTGPYDASESVYPFNSMVFTTQKSPNSDVVRKAYDFPETSWELDPNTTYTNGHIGDEIVVDYEDYSFSKIIDIPIFQYDGASDGVISMVIGDDSTLYVGSDHYYTNRFVRSIHGYIYSGGTPDDQIPNENRGIIKLWINDGEHDWEFITYGATGYDVKYPYMHDGMGLGLQIIAEGLKTDGVIDDLTYYVISGIANNSVPYDWQEGYYNQGDALKFNYTVSESMDDAKFRKHYTFTLDRFKHGRNRGYNGSYSYRIDFDAHDFYTNYDNNWSGVFLTPQAGWFGSIHVERICAVKYTTVENFVDGDGNAYNVLSVHTKHVTEIDDYYFNDTSQTTQAVLTPVPSMWDIDGFYNSDLTILSWDYCNIDVTIIPDRNTINTPNAKEELTLTMTVWYDDDPSTHFESWFRQQSGDFFQPIPDRPNVTDTDFIQWLSNTTGGFLNTQLFGGITLGQIIWFAIGVGVFFALLKYFVGG